MLVPDSNSILTTRSFKLVGSTISLHRRSKKFLVGYLLFVGWLLPIFPPSVQSLKRTRKKKTKKQEI